MTHLFTIGQVLHGAFETVDGYTRYTLLAYQANPWHLLVKEFPEGHIFTGRVVNIVEGLDAFVHVGHGVRGLIPEKLLPPAYIGTEVRVGVVRMDVEVRKIQLRPIGSGDRHSEPDDRRPSRSATVSLPRGGERHDAEVVRTVPENGRSGGYALVRLADGPTVMLHADVRGGPVRPQPGRTGGRRAPGGVEVVRVNGERRMWVRDIPNPVEEGETEAKPQAA